MQNIEEQTKETEELCAKLETLLFVSPGPVAVGHLAEALQIGEAKVRELLRQMGETYRDHRGIRLQRLGDQYQLTSASEHAELIEKFLGLEVTTRLTQAALEALAIIAYKQPATRPDIDAIRGVNSDGVIKSLLSKGLIEELGRSEGVGRPILYGVTGEFLQHFGLDSLDELPKIDFEALIHAQPEPTEEKRVLKD